MKLYVPFAYQKYGRIEVEANSREEAIHKAEKVLEDMNVSDMEALGDYLQDSEDIDKDGLVLDENGNIIDE